MKYAILSDIHANPEALRRVLEDARGVGVEKFVCLGDVVGYGPLPKEALALVRETDMTVLAGNHDDAVSGRLDPEAFIDLAGEAVSRHREALGRDDLDWLRGLPHTCEGDGFVASHGDFTEPSAFNYVDTADDARANFEAFDTPLAFVGHTHVPVLFLTGASGAVYRVEPQDFSLEEGKRYLVNPGSVGYPREANGRCLSSYVVYDSGVGTVEFRFLPFSVSSLLQRGRAVGRFRRLALLGGAIFAILAALAAIAFVALREPKVVRVGRTVVRRVSLPVRGGVRLSPNLRLARGSKAVDLRVLFLNADGSTNGLPETLTVKASSRRKFRAPEGAVAAEFSLLEAAPGQKPEVLAFNPAEAE